MDRQIETIRRQLDAQAGALAQLEKLLRQQADTANRRCDATFKTLSDGFRGMNSRLDQHELVFEALDGRLDEAGGIMTAAR